MFVLVPEVDAGVRFPVGARPVYVGRAATNDLVLDADTVSGRHASLWSDGGRVFVEDLRSRNGTFVNGVRVEGVARARDGDVVVFGDARFSVRREGADMSVRALILCDVASGTRTALRKERIRVGSPPDADVVVDGVDATLGLDPDGTVWLGVDDDVHPLAVGAPFELGGRTFRLDAEAAPPGATRDLVAVRYAYTLEASLHSEPGPTARLLEQATGRVTTITAENRATLLWLLAKKRQDDLDARTPDADAGWCDVQDVVVGVWGRAPGATVENLRVLLCRVRRELKESGFDPWFLEHRGQHLRARVAEARAV
jgi:hypothetical protein